MTGLENLVEIAYLTMLNSVPGGYSSYAAFELKYQELRLHNKFSLFLFSIEFANFFECQRKHAALNVNFLGFCGFFPGIA